MTKSKESSQMYNKVIAQVEFKNALLYPSILIGFLPLALITFSLTILFSPTAAYANNSEYTPISSAADLDLIRNNLKGKFKLTQNIDLDGAEIEPIGGGSESLCTAPPENYCYEWLFQNGNEFEGELDGNGFSISNFKIVQDTPGAALFRETYGAKIKNLTLDNAAIFGAGHYIAALVGRDHGGSEFINIGFNNIELHTSVYQTLFYHGISPNYIGGLAGKLNSRSIIDNTYGSVSITLNTKKSFYIGGLVGDSRGSIVNSLVSVYITFGPSAYGGSVGPSFMGLGGLVGWMYRTEDCLGQVLQNPTIDNSGALINFDFDGVIGSSFSDVGGLVGFSRGGLINNSFAQGNLSDLAGETVGGLIGTLSWFNYTAPIEVIRNSYASVVLPAYTSAPTALVGYIYDLNQYEISNSFWNNDLAPQSSSSFGTGVPFETMLGSQLYLEAGWDEANWLFNPMSLPFPQTIPFKAPTFFRPQDFNGDYKVDAADLAMLLSTWGASGLADLNNDGTTNGADLGVFLCGWGRY